MSEAGLKSEVVSGAGEGRQEGRGPPTGAVGSRQEFGLHPKGTGELWMGLKER